VNIAVQDVAPWGSHWSVAVSMVGNFFVAISVVYFAAQARGLKAQTKMLELKTAEDIKVAKQQLHMESVGSLQHFFLEMFKHPELAHVWEVGRNDFQALDADQLRQFKWACVYWFEHIGSLHRMVESDLIDKDDLEGWKKAIADDFMNDKKPGLIHFWKVLEEDYEDAFKNWVHEIIGGELLCDCPAHAKLLTKE
jgi:hypothetical protein